MPEVYKNLINRQWGAEARFLGRMEVCSYGRKFWVELYRLTDRDGVDRIVAVWPEASGHTVATCPVNISPTPQNPYLAHALDLTRTTFDSSIGVNPVPLPDL